MKDNSLEGILLVSDMDGTLLNANKHVSPQNLRALKRFVAKGGLFTIATGRINKSVEPYLSSLPVNAPAILYNGGLIYDFEKQQILWDKTLPVGIQDDIHRIIDKFPGIGIEIYTDDGEVNILTENEFTNRHLTLEELDFQCLKQERGYRLKPWRKILFAWEPEKLKRLESWLKREEISLPFVRSELHFLEILPLNVNKGTALNALIRDLNLNRSKVVAMGDNPNDIEMLQTAGVGIAVANAHDSLKEVASFCCIHHEQHAVSEVVEWIENEL